MSVSDRTFLMHLGGKIEIRNKVPLKTRDDLSMAYTPGVARVCLAIREDPERVFALTIKQNTVAIVTDGTAVLGLGDIGPHAALPVMEGKSLLFKDLAGVDAFPVCLATKDVDEIVRTVKNIAPVYGGINLEDISAPRCFEIEERLQQELDIPVFHDDQHGTAVVVLAALLNALRIVGKELADISAVVCGVGAAGTATIRILRSVGVRGSWASTSTASWPSGGRGRGRHEGRVAQETNPEARQGSLSDAVQGADVFIGLSRARRAPARRTSRRWGGIRSSSPWPIRCRRSCRRRRSPSSGSWRRAGPTTRTRSTTCSASRASSGACSTAGRPESPTR